MVAVRSSRFEDGLERIDEMDRAEEISIVKYCGEVIIGAKGETNWYNAK